MVRQLTWIDDGKVEGWTCSECAWTYPIPELLADPEAKAAYDRIAFANFRKHACRATPEEQNHPIKETFSDCEILSSTE